MFGRILRSGLILCLCTAALAVTANAQQPASEHKRALIQELITLTISKVDLDSMVDVILRQYEEEIPKQVAARLQANKELKPAEREQMRQELTAKSLRFSKRFRELLPQRINMKQEIESIVLIIYDKYFTEEELSQIVAFHKSPAGRKMTELMPQLVPEMMKRIRDAVTPKVEALGKELMAEEQGEEKPADDEAAPTPDK